MLAGGLGTSPQGFNVITYREGLLFRSIELGNSAGTTFNSNQTTQILVFEMFGLTIYPNLPNFGV